MGNTTRNTTENTTRNTTTESNNSKAATTTSINSDDAILQLDLNQMNEKKRERKEEEGKLREFQQLKFCILSSRLSAI